MEETLRRNKLALDKIEVKLNAIRTLVGQVQETTDHIQPAGFADLEWKLKLMADQAADCLASVKSAGDKQREIERSFAPTPWRATHRR
jgi:hypothetical protein